jgi:hypothetical protein
MQMISNLKLKGMDYALYVIILIDVSGSQVTPKYNEK